MPPKVTLGRRTLYFNQKLAQPICRVPHLPLWLCRCAESGESRSGCRRRTSSHPLWGGPKAQQLDHLTPRCADRRTCAWIDVCRRFNLRLFALLVRGVGNNLGTTFNRDGSTVGIAAVLAVIQGV